MNEITAVIFARSPGALVDRCVRSVSSLADKTLVIYSVAAEGSHFAWNDAFDDLYNYGIAQVTSGWILHLNEDEFLQDGAQKRISKAIESGRSGAYRLISEERIQGGMIRSEIVRLWKADQGVHYQGCAFPELTVEDSTVLDVKLFHEPNLGVEERKVRDIRLVRKELSIRPGSIRYEAILAQHLAADSPEESASVRKDIVDRILSDTKVVLPPRLSTWLFIAELQSLNDSEILVPRTDAVIRAAWRLCGRSPNVMWAIANCEQRRGDVFCAMHAWMEIDEVLNTRSFDPACPPEPVVQGAALYRNLGQSALMLDRLELARRSLKRALALDPNDAAARLLLQRI